MSESGYQVEHQYDARSLIDQEVMGDGQLDPDEAERERARALVDVACQQSSGLADAYFALTDRMTRQFVEENSQQLDGLRQLTATAIRNVVDATPG